MIAVDTNLLVYAHRQDAPEHPRSLAVLRPVFEGPAAWGLPWPCAHEFIAVSTHPRIYKPASTLDQALGFLEGVFASPNLQLLSESPGYFQKLSELARSAQVTGGRIHDARIAALCLHHGVTELWSADRDFSRFPQLRTRNPL